QAADGIRDFHVTGVQTCALPISQTTLENLRQTFPNKPDITFISGPHSDVLIGLEVECSWRSYFPDLWTDGFPDVDELTLDNITRSEERRVGKAGRGRASACG